MIQDKDFTLRLIRQLTQALEKLLLGKPEESLMQKELDFDSLMKDIFKIDFKELALKSKEELIEIVKKENPKTTQIIMRCWAMFLCSITERKENWILQTKLKLFTNYICRPAGFLHCQLLTELMN